MNPNLKLLLILVILFTSISIYDKITQKGVYINWWGGIVVGFMIWISLELLMILNNFLKLG
jgi:hypothetical protein